MPGTGGNLLVQFNRQRSDMTQSVLSAAPFDALPTAWRRADARITMTEVGQRIPDGFEVHVRRLFDLTPAEAELLRGLKHVASYLRLSGSVLLSSATSWLC